MTNILYICLYAHEFERVSLNKRLNFWTFRDSPYKSMFRFGDPGKSNNTRKGSIQAEVR